MQGTPVVVNTPSYTFTGLTNGTDYIVRVRGICGTDDTTAVRSRSVQTLCGYLQLPYSESFEDASGTASTYHSGMQNNLPNCWDYHNEGTNNYFSIYPYVLVGSAHSGSNFMRCQVALSAYYSPQYAFLPLTDPIIHPINSLELSYWICRLNSTPSTCIVGITPDPTDISTFIPVDTIIRNDDGWIQRTVLFNNYTGPHGRVTILFPRQTGHPNSTRVDDIYLFSHNSFDTVTHTACNSYTWPENGITYTNSGNYNHTLPNAAGYDSIITLQLTINYSSTGDTMATACNSFSWYGNSYTSTTNSATHSFTNAAGCDSVVTLHLTINHSNTGDTTATACDSFSWWNTNYTNSTNSATHTFTNAAGCDSVVTLHLTVNHSNTGDTTVTACNSFTWWGNSHTSSTNTATHTFTNAAGCDSVVTLHLTMNHSNTGDTTATACNSFTWWGTNYTSSTNAATHTFTNAAGCDSVVTLHLTVNHSTTGDTTATACNSFTWWGTNYTSSTNTATHTFTNAAGCDSVVTLHLTINHSNSGDTTATACNSFTWWGTSHTSSTNAATHTYTNAAGCDSIVTLHLTVNYSNTGIEDTTVCNSIVWHGTEYTTSTNTPTFTCLNAVGCDSVTTLHLTVNHCSTTPITVCDSYSWRGHTYTTTGIFIDGTDTLNLTVNHSNTGDTSATACGNFTWWGNSYTSSTNTATHTFTNAAGCDSVVTLHLTMNQSNTGDTTATACNSFTWWGNSYTNSTNSATHPFINAAGCDSVVTLHLTINHSNTGDTTVTACNSFTWWGNNYASSTNSATHTFTNAAGCDSVVTLHLTVNYSNTGIEDTTVCNSFVWHGTEYTTSTNTPTFTCPNAAGCDSVITLHLTVNQCSSTLVTVCDSYTWRGHTYTATGIYIDGADTLNLTVGHSNTGDTSATACDSFTWWGNSYTSSTNTATHTFTNAAGCDSVVTLHLTMNQSNTGDTTATACNSFTWWGTNYTNSTNVATHTYTNATGCDSVITLHLTIIHSNTGDTTATACDSFTWWGTNYTSSTNSVTHIFTNVNDCDSVVTLNLTVNATAVLNHTPDTTILVGESITLSVDNIDNVTWYDADGNILAISDSLVIAPTSSTTYYISGFNQDTSIAINGDFEAGNVHFTSGYTYTSNLVPEGKYYVGPNSHNYHTGFPNWPDHTSGNGNYMIVNGTTSNGITVWSQTVPVLPNTDYDFSAWVCNVSLGNPDNVAYLQFSINGVQLGNVFHCPASLYTWEQFYEVWNSGENTTATISILNLNTTSAGNDFGIDDIRFSALTSCIGHDSIQVNVQSGSDTYIDICDNQLPYTWNGETFTSGGVYDVLIPRPASVDSMATLHLTVKSSSTGDTMATACDSFTWWNTNYTNSTNTATHTFTNAAGCDSVVTLHLTINSSNTGDTTATACDSFTWWGTYYTNSTNTATHTFTNAAGCDSVVTLHLTLNLSTDSTVMDTVTENELPYLFHGLALGNDTTLTITIPNTAGCDSVVTLNLTVVRNVVLTMDSTICESLLPFTWNDSVFYSAGTKQRTLTTTLGTDSTITMTLNVIPTAVGFVFDTIVENSLPYSFMGHLYTSDTVGDTLLTTAHSGCDSLVVFNLHIHHNVATSTDSTVCTSQLPLSWNGVVFTAAGVETATMQAVSGADSVVTMTVAVSPEYLTTDTMEVCSDAFPLTWRDTSFAAGTMSGHYTRSHHTAAGCDSTLMLNLTIFNPAATIDIISSCEALVWIDGNTYSHSTDSATFTLQTLHGCDSTVTLHFEMLATSHTSIADSFCAGTEYLFGALTLTEGGQYSDTLTAANSCDSIVDLSLTKLSLPTIRITTSSDCNSLLHNIHAETDVNYLYWSCSETSWNNSWGSQSSHDLSIGATQPLTLTLLADYHETPTCPNTAQVTLQPIVQPHAVMTVTPEFLTTDAPTLLAISQSTGANRLQWYLDGDDAGSEPSITHTPPFGSDSVVVTLMAFSDLCSDTTEKTIYIKQQTLYVPNAFTPNESTNNTFSIFFDGIVEYELYIYSRQGILIYHSTTNGDAWDGHYKGQPCPQGAYVWLVRYRSEVDPRNWHTQKGTVTLIY